MSDREFLPNEAMLDVFLRSKEGGSVLKMLNLKNDDHEAIINLAKQLSCIDALSTLWLAKLYRLAKGELRKNVAAALWPRSDAAKYLADY